MPRLFPPLPRLDGRSINLRLYNPEDAAAGFNFATLDGAIGQLDQVLSDAVGMGGPPTGPAGGALTGFYPNPGVQYSLITGIPTIPTTLPPSGSAGGVLAGTYPAPSFAAGAVTTPAIGDLQVTDGKIVSLAYSKLTGVPAAGQTVAMKRHLTWGGSVVTGSVVIPMETPECIANGPVFITCRISAYIENTDTVARTVTMDGTLYRDGTAGVADGTVLLTQQQKTILTPATATTLNCTLELTATPTTVAIFRRIQVGIVMAGVSGITSVYPTGNGGSLVALQFA